MTGSLWRGTRFLMAGLYAGLVLCTQSVADPLCAPTNLRHWVESPEAWPAQREAQLRWAQNARLATQKWWVERMDSGIQARCLKGKPAPMNGFPSFAPTTTSAAQAIGPNWLLGLDHGEWGGVLVWADAQGQPLQRLKLKQSVRALLEWGGGRWVLTGTNHMLLDIGELQPLRHQPGAEPAWSVDASLKLPGNPHAWAPRRDGSLIVVTQRTVVAVWPDGRMETLLQPPRASANTGEFPFAQPLADWPLLAASSAALTADERMLYVGMPHAVIELDLERKQWRALVPPAPK